MAAGRWVGRGDKNGADGAAVNAMRQLISTVSMNGVVVIGEGEKDEAPMLYNGEQVGDGNGPECDVAVDPIDGTTLTAKGMSNAIVGDGGRRPRLDVRPVRRLLHGEARHRPRGRRRRRHPAPVAREHPPGRQGQARLAPRTSPSSSSTGRATRSSSRRSATTGARIKFITDGDVAGAIMAARDGTGIDLLLGIGGTPEGIIAACAIKCLGGVIQGRLWPKDDDERQKRDRRRPRPRPGPRHRRPGPRRQRASSSPPASPTASCSRACATAPAAPTTHSLVMRSQAAARSASSTASTGSTSCAPTPRSTSSARHDRLLAGRPHLPAPPGPAAGGGFSVDDVRHPRHADHPLLRKLLRCRRAQHGVRERHRRQFQGARRRRGAAVHEAARGSRRHAITAWCRTRSCSAPTRSSGSASTPARSVRA